MHAINPKETIKAIDSRKFLNAKKLFENVLTLLGINPVNNKIQN
jgi:hypothetical protein